MSQGISKAGSASWSRLSVPVLTGRGGAGLGNEIVAWAKALIGAEELGLKAVHPPWGLNKRRYWKDFGTSRFDWPLHQALRVLPTITINEFGGYDYAEVMARHRQEVDDRRGPLVVRHASGMSGGYLAIQRSRPLLLAKLMAPPHVSRDLYAIERRLDPNRLTVALHVRAGDFDATSAPRPGEFNKRIPFDWYRRIAASLAKHFPGGVQFLAFTDGPDSEAMEQLGHGPFVPLPERASPVLSDLVAMSQADLLVSSVSSFGMLAGFMSNKPYIWYGPHLGRSGGWLSIWSHEPTQKQAPTAGNATEAPPNHPLIVRGNPVGADGVIPETLLETLERSLSMKRLRHDLLMYGVVPDCHSADSETPSR